jgi:bacteriocin biosynthesis cyclodehydratase domain-containing protein
MNAEEQIVTALPVQIVDLPDGILVRRGATQLRIAGSGLRLIIELIFALACAEGTSKAEIRELVLPRFPDLTAAALETLFDSLTASRLLQAPGDDAAGRPGDANPSISVFRWDCGVADGRSLTQARMIIVGVNQIARRLKSALASCGIDGVTVIDDPSLRSARLCHADGTLDAAAWGHADPIAQEDVGFVLELGVDLMVAASELGNQHAFRPWNELAVERGIPLLPVLLVDGFGQIGPLVQPGQGPCLECLRARQNANLERSELLRVSEMTSHLHQDAIGFLPPMTDVLGGIAALEAVKFWMSPRRFESVGHLLDIDLLTPAMMRRKVLKIPRCRVCGATRQRASARLSKALPVSEVS